jgi:ferritin-like metal-binding protein YciE
MQSKETAMPKLNSLDDLLVHELQDIYNAEGQVLKALPRMIKAASHRELQSAFEEHLEQTEGQVERLDQVFKLLGVPAKGKKCEGMAGLIEEGKKLMEENAEPAVLEHVPLDVALTVPPTEAKGLGPTLDLAERLARHGYTTAPHLAARLVRDDAHLTDIVAQLREAGVQSVFVIGGDAAEPAGTFPDALRLLQRLDEIGHPFSTVGIGGYPEGHGHIPADLIDRHSTAPPRTGI